MQSDISATTADIEKRISDLQINFNSLSSHRIRFNNATPSTMSNLKSATIIQTAPKPLPEANLRRPLFHTPNISETIPENTIENNEEIKKSQDVEAFLVKINRILENNGYDILLPQPTNPGEITIDFYSLLTLFRKIMQDLNNEESKASSKMQSELSQIRQEKKEVDQELKYFDASRNSKSDELKLSYKNEIEILNRQHTAQLQALESETSAQIIMKDEEIASLKTMIRSRDAVIEELEKNTRQLQELSLEAENLNIDNQNLLARNDEVVESYNRLLSETEQERYKLDYEIRSLKHELMTARTLGEAKRKPSSVSIPSSVNSTEAQAILDQVKEVMKVKRNSDVVIGMKKMMQLLSAVQKMESFIKEICKLVFPPNSEANIDSVIPVLNEWKSKFSRTQSVQFQEVNKGSVQRGDKKKKYKNQSTIKFGSLALGEQQLVFRKRKSLTFYTQIQSVELYKAFLNEMQDMCKERDIDSLAEMLRGAYFLGLEIRPFIQKIKELLKLPDLSLKETMDTTVEALQEAQDISFLRSLVEEVMQTLNVGNLEDVLPAISSLIQQRY